MATSVSALEYRFHDEMLEIYRRAKVGFAGTRRSRFQAVAKATPRSAPGHQFHGSIVKLLQAKLELLLPRFRRAFVDRRVQAFDQRIDQRGTRLRWQGEDIVKQVRSM